MLDAHHNFNDSKPSYEYIDKKLLSSTDSININSKVFEYFREFALVAASESGGGGGGDQGGEGGSQTLLRGGIFLLYNYLVNYRHILSLKKRSK